jgi:lantibiotic modifying enzyme
LKNIIAAGEYPMLVDLELLFHPRIGQADPEHAEQLAVNKTSSSVLKVGLLPQPSWAYGESEGVDLSGLASMPGQLSPRPVPRWQAGGTDQMRLTRERVEILTGNNRPTLNGAEVNVADYMEAVVEGFTSCYRLLLRHRNDLVAGGGPLSRFAEDEVRVIFRPTYTYDRTGSTFALERNGLGFVPAFFL